MALSIDSTAGRDSTESARMRRTRRSALKGSSNHCHSKRFLQQPAHVLQQLDVARRNFPRLEVEMADAPKHPAIPVHERDAAVELHGRPLRMVADALVAPGVRHP